MPNWCDNTLTISGSKEQIDGLEKVINDYENTETEDPAFFGHYVPVTEEDQTVWGQANAWGTKWEPQIYDWYRDEDSIIIQMSTAWGPPIEFYNEMEETHNFSIQASYYEPGMCFVGEYDGQHFDYAEMSSEDIRSEIPNWLDEMYGISEGLAEWEEEERKDREEDARQKVKEEQLEFDYDRYNGGVEDFGK